MNDKPTFKEFCEKHFDADIYTWQERILNEISEVVECGKPVLFYDPRREMRFLKKQYKQWAQLICDHEWVDNVLLIGSEGEKNVTACLSCQKVLVKTKESSDD